MLPAPCSERWKPLRAGLVDMFYYDAEEFWFHDGRLLLRGNNGTGKSKVLALTLPFLLDGELAPHRVEPDGDRQKKMEWNLLLGGKHPHPERLGYTWLEFGRRAADGTAEFCTIGCGLKAVAGRGVARHWFFVTTQRVGAGLDLLPASRVPLTREKLREEIDGHGLVYDRAGDYRRAVDEALFGLGEHRYEALINLLIQLRQPQLSKRPDERLLSRALTEALPPLSPGLVTTVADAFRGLDEERDALRALSEAHTAATDFLHHYRRYARVAAKRRATGPRQAQSRYEQLGRDLTAAEEAYAAADAELQAARGELEELERERTRLEARREALRADPAMRDAGELDRRHQDARRQGEMAREREQTRDRLTVEVTRRSAKASEAAQRAAAAEHELHAAQDTAGAAAEAARCAPGHRAAIEGWREDLPRARRAAHEVADRRAGAIGQLERLLAEVAAHSSALAAARAEVDRLTAEIQAATDRVTATELESSERAGELARAYRFFLRGLTELRVADPEELISGLEAWAATGDGANPAVAVIDDAARAAGAELGRLGAELSARRSAHAGHARELEAEIERLRAGGHDAPPAPHTRDPQVRDTRPGAPLWQVTDFAPGVPDDHRAGLEAALEAAGILDAWLTPGGDLIGSDLIDGDVVLVSGRHPVTGPSCHAVLVPAVNAGDPQAAALPETAVRAALAAIGLGPGTGATWVTTDGRWANGVLSGSWHKDAAGHIGAGARETVRRDRIARLSAELAEVNDAIAALDETIDELDRRQDRLAAEHRAVPADAAVREAHTRAAEQRKRRQELRDARAEAERVHAARQEALAVTRTAADEFAADTHLPADPEQLAVVRTGLGDYRVALAALWPAAEKTEATSRSAAEAAGELAETRQHLTEAAERAGSARATATAAQALYEALLETAGAAVEELNRKLDELRRDTERRSADEHAARELEQQAISDRGRAEGTRDTLRTEIAEAARVRDGAVAEFRAFAATGVLRIALPDLELPDPAEPWPSTPAVILARAVNAALEGTDDADAGWDRLQRKVNEEHKLLADAMARHGHSAGLTVRDGIMVVDVVFQGRSHDIPGLAEALRTEAEQRARLLSAREREILENHLLNEVAGTLHELITAAEAEVRGMNDELESRPTSTGMKLRLTWQQARDAPDGLDQVRRKLRQTIDAWSAADRAAVGAFLQQRIAGEHAANPAAGWAEALTAALDYRRWHEFAIQRYQDGQWRPAAGPASGGERALAASVPLFAAASAHYKSAGNPNAPRLIALDEAFAGVDDDSRAKCLGLLATFDMDVVMTSEREWGCYPQVPGLGICQLARQEGVDAVLVTAWRWDGRERRRGRISGPVTETPVTETPVTETPVTETPVTETPVTETPVTETPVTETPVTETPATETPATEVGARLHRLLGDEPSAWLVRRARDRLETGRPLTGTVTLAAATPEQRRAVERLIGRAARSGASLSVSLAEVDRILRDSGAAPGGLAEAVRRLTGPLRDLTRERADLAAAWSAAFAPLDEAAGGHDELARWREWLDATGLVRRLAAEPDQARLLLAQVAAVLRRLPSPGVPIGRLAAECCADAHALDDGRPVGTVALSAARALAGLPFAAEPGADSRRTAWAAVGVHLDDLSSLVLCLGLPGDSRTPLGRLLASCREAGQPAVLTLRQLRCHAEPLNTGPLNTGSLNTGPRRAARVWICENPVVVAAAADELGAAGQPLVCVGGQPSAAGWRLLELLAAGGAEFGYHGDFDWGGVRIARTVHDRVNWRPWRYDRQAYEAAASAAHPLTPLAGLAGEPAATPWDPELAAAMRHRNVRIEEELTLDALLQDLSPG